jgi:hypothetical protein
MVLACAYLIEIGSHRYVGITQSFMRRLGEHWRRCMDSSFMSPLYHMIREHSDSKSIRGRILAVYDIPCVRCSGKDMNISERINSRIMEKLEHLWVKDLEADLNNYRTIKYSSKHLRELHDKYWISHGGGRTMTLSDAYDIVIPSNKILYEIEEN